MATNNRDFAKSQQKGSYH